MNYLFEQQMYVADAVELSVECRFEKFIQFYQAINTGWQT